MLPQPAPAPLPAAADFTPIGVGIDTSRYGHYAKSIQGDGASEAPMASTEKHAVPYVGFGSLELNASILTRFDKPVPATRCGFSGPIREGKTKPFLLEIAATSLLAQAFQPCP